MISAAAFFVNDRLELFGDVDWSLERIDADGNGAAENFLHALHRINVGSKNLG